MLQDHNHLNHATWECKYHVVFTPKYRKKVLFGQIRRRLGCRAQKPVMQQPGKCGVTRRAQVPRRSFGMLAEGGALPRRMERRWRSGPRGGRPKTPPDIRQLILEMSVANPLCGPPRIHGELLKLGIDVGQTTVAKYMAKRRRPPSQGWKTFLRNHADGIASIDMFVVPTISFRQSYGLLVLRHSRRELLWLGVTAHPSAEWIARRLTEACGWSEPPR